MKIDNHDLLYHFDFGFLWVELRKHYRGDHFILRTSGKDQPDVAYTNQIEATQAFCARVLELLNVAQAPTEEA